MGASGAFLSFGAETRASRMALERLILTWVAVINRGAHLPGSFAAQLRCSLGTNRHGCAPRSRVAGRQNPVGILPLLFITAALNFIIDHEDT